MRAMLFIGRFLLALLVVAPAAEAQLAAPDPKALAAFAEKAGLRDVTGFVETVQSLRASGKLPPRYATKDEAAAHGWHGGYRPIPKRFGYSSPGPHPSWRRSRQTWPASHS